MIYTLDKRIYHLPLPFTSYFSNFPILDFTRYDICRHRVASSLKEEENNSKWSTIVTKTGKIVWDV